MLFIIIIIFFRMKSTTMDNTDNRVASTKKFSHNTCSLFTVQKDAVTSSNVHRKFTKKFNGQPSQAA